MTRAEVERLLEPAALLFPGLLPGIPAYPVKVHAKFPGQEPAIRGLIPLHDLQPGALLAVLESNLSTAVRTALAGAVADVLTWMDLVVAWAVYERAKVEGIGNAVDFPA